VAVGRGGARAGLLAAIGPATLILYGGAVLSSSGGAPKRGSTVAFPVDSVQVKDRET
jgi:hypothetical protein